MLVPSKIKPMIGPLGRALVLYLSLVAAVTVRSCPVDDPEFEATLVLIKPDGIAPNPCVVICCRRTAGSLLFGIAQI